MKNLLIASSLAVALCGSAFAATTTTTTTTSTPAAAASTTAAATATTATISITPKKKTTLVAAGTISWAAHSTEKLAVKWTGPTGMGATHCEDSTHKIKMGSTSFKSSRTPWYQDANGAPVACKGVWTAAVVDTLTGKVLATTTYTVNS